MHTFVCRLLKPNTIAPLCVRFGSASAPQKTCLFEFHKSNGGKMVDFAGWHMPVQYADQSIAQSTVHTRNHCSVFDVSHMLQSKIYGNDRIAFLESIITADVEGLAPDQGSLSVFTTPEGGIRDDLIATKTSGDHIYMVTNAGCIEEDSKHILENEKAWKDQGKDIQVDIMHGHGLVAVQGPKMMEIVKNNVDFDLTKLYFMRSLIGTVFGIENCRITRCGYTGEDGVEISVSPDRAAELCEKLLKSDAHVKLAGLGARDALRLEAGLCLYGNDIDLTTTPVEAGLTFVVAKRRRKTLDFPGAEVIVGQIKNKNPRQKRVGLIAESGRPARAGATIHDPATGDKVGHVTSGCPSPSLKQNIAHAYVSPKFAKNGTELSIDVSGKGGKQIPFKVTKMPFVKAHYYTGK